MFPWKPLPPKPPGIFGQFVKAAVGATASHATEQLARGVGALHGEESLATKLVRAGQTAIESQAGRHAVRYSHKSEQVGDAGAARQVLAGLLDAGMQFVTEQKCSAHSADPAQAHAQGRRAEQAGQPAEAARLYHAAALQGCVPAMNDLAWCHDAGWGVAQDKAEAARWYRVAAERGNLNAQANFAMLLHEAGQHEEAARWSRAAAEQGDSTGQYLTGFYHQHGRGGTAQNLAEARRWYGLAAAQGVPEAAAALAGIDVGPHPQVMPGGGAGEGSAHPHGSVPWARAELGVDAGAGAADIKAAYRRLMRMAHPDLGGDAEFAADLNLARKVLLG
jgi:TPR repeat protein